MAAMSSSGSLRRAVVVILSVSIVIVKYQLVSVLEIQLDMIFTSEDPDECNRQGKGHHENDMEEL